MESRGMLVFHTGFYMVALLRTYEFYAITWIARQGEGEGRTC
ncbi:MAG TPA: hypothetical protein VJ695_00230 [Nitrososphaera sp.]|nr:hypothetical protein [Nitrososphaera sp.]